MVICTNPFTENDNGTKVKLNLFFCFFDSSKNTPNYYHYSFFLIPHFYRGFWKSLCFNSSLNHEYVRVRLNKLKPGSNNVINRLWWLFAYHVKPDSCNYYHTSRCCLYEIEHFYCALFFFLTQKHLKAKWNQNSNNFLGFINLKSLKESY